MLTHRECRLEVWKVEVLFEIKIQFILGSIIMKKTSEENNEIDKKDAEDMKQEHKQWGLN